VLCLHFPELLTTPQLRAVYPMPLMRRAIQVGIGTAFLLGLLSAALRRRKVLGFTGMGLALAASLLGGVRVGPARSISSHEYLGLDWFILNLLLLAVVFVPMERRYPRWPEQGVFRRGWTTDLLYFFVSHLLVQVSTFLTLMPAGVLFHWAAQPQIQAAVAAQPRMLQFLEVVLVADLCEYGVHRLFHRVPALWRFHQIHHSSRALDWLAGSRLHIVDIVVTRGLSFVPLYVLGFDTGAVYAYLVFVSFHAVLIHANVRFRFGRLERLIVTPRFHHWHHSAQAEAIDRNFAVHLPWIDRLFGSHHCPGETWPSEYGIAGHPVPEGYAAQWLHPLVSSRPGAGPPRS
jgi:lathosterol oxidase